MKTKLLFISLCLILGIALNTANAQKKDKKTEQGWYTSTYWSPVFCDDILVDVLSGGEIRIHYVYHYNPGKDVWEIDQIKGEVTSSLTGETFRIREVDKYYFIDNWFVTWHYNLIGDAGSHYIGTLTYNYATGEITVGKTVCH